MNQADLQAALLKFAKSDLNKVRKERTLSLYIAQTKVGLVELNYDASNKTYSARNVGLGAAPTQHFVNAKAKEAAAKLVTLYDVVVTESPS